MEKNDLPTAHFSVSLPGITISILERVTMARDLSPIHPGEVLLEEFMKPLSLSQYRLAKDLGVAPTRINQILYGHRALRPDIARRLARYFGTAERFCSICSHALT